MQILVESQLFKKMVQSNIQERKLNVIEKLILIDDEKVFKQVEDIIDSSLNRPRLKRFTNQEIINRAMQANKDIEDGNVYTKEEVGNLSQDW